jgi:hypothetical protein
MPTVAKTFVFAADAEGLADQGNSATITFAWQTGDSQSGSGGCVKFTTTSKSTTSTEYAYKTATTDTWETWGVPAGATVTSVQVSEWYERTVAVTKISSQAVSIRVVNSSNTTVHSAGDLIAAYDPGTGANATWQSATAGSVRAVDSSYQASTTSVRLRIDQTIVTSGSSSAASVDQRYDGITLTITYTAFANLSDKSTVGETVAVTNAMNVGAY